ncbi:MAG: ABC transporter ATP-binding protein [Halofilum sp. (in: g-proteobacteria)]|nr:ABC transporter ATP-binding protein [Halofilum sp. (in: g-proteobacteria)]
MASDNFVQFSEVQKSYDGETLVVKNLNLDIEKGEFVTMLGPSGSGKTTCLMMLAGFEPATHGEIYLDGEPINNVAPHKRGIGMVFQNYALFPHMTVAENVAFPLQVRKYPKAKSRIASRRRSTWSAWASSAIAVRRSCPVASSSVSPRPARWCSSPSWC